MSDGRLGPLFANPTSNIFINEIHYDNTGADTNEGVEVAGPAGTNLAGWTIIPYNGSGGASYTPSATLTGVIPNQQNGMGTLNFPIAGLQNGAPDGIALVNGSTLVQFLCYEGTFTATNGAANGVACTSIGVSEAGTEVAGLSLQLQGSGNTYGNFTWAGPIAHTRGAVNTGQTFTTPADSAPGVQSTTPANNASNVAVNSNISITFSEPVTATGAWYQISCSSSGTHTAVESGGTTTYTLDPATDFTAGETCSVTVFAAQVADVDAADPPNNMTADFSFTFLVAGGCGDTFTPIYTIQGSGPASPLDGSVVVTEGLVVGDFQGSAALSGFYIQDPGGDANTATSDGMFVFDGAAPAVSVAVGDRVRVTGTVDEFNNLTEITSVSSVLICSTGNPVPLPTAVDLPEPLNDDLERYENMLTTIPETLTVTGNFGLGRFGEVSLSSDGRLFQQNNFDRTNSPGALATANLNQRRYVVLDDGRTLQNPDPTPYFDANNTRRVGDTITGLTGVLTFSFSEYRVQPTVTPNFTSANPRTAAPAAVGGLVKASSFNVLNYFNGDGAGGGFPTSRGADSAAEFTRQRDKIIAAIVAINADVYGVIEIENDGNGSTSAIQDLVNGLNAATAAGTYAFAEGTTPGTDLIKNSIIYKPGTVTPVGPAVNDTDAVFTGQARNPLAQTFMLNSNSARLVFIVNHFTSKACSANDTGADADQGDGEGCDSLQRTLQAQALLDFVEERQTTTGEARVLVMGDLNASGEEDPIFELENDTSDQLADGPGGLIDLIQRLVPMADRYTYQFDEQSAYIDHALASKELDKYISGTTIWHINADEPTVLDYNFEFKTAAQQAINQGTPYRSSDHDPVIVGINLLPPTAADGTVAGRITDANGLAVSGVVVSLGGSQTRKTITDANGDYVFDKVETSGFYTVTPSRANYSFGPASRSFSQLGNTTEAAFTGSPNSVIIGTAIDTSEYFVRQHYLDFLSREPDESGFNFWSDQILECGADAGCIERRRINVSAAYFLSVEFQETGGLVDGLYRASFGRAPKYAEFMPDTAAISQNIVVGRGDWQQELAANKRAFIESFVGRAAFQAAWGRISDTGYVDALVANTRVSFSAEEREALVSGLGTGALTRADVLLRVAKNDAFVTARRNEAFVMMQYFGYLRRDPDESGHGFWLQKLNRFNGNFEQAEMVKAFINSGEYRARFQR